MHRLPKIFSLTKNRPEDSSNSCPFPPPTTKKQIHRCSALKSANNDFSPTTSASSPSCSEQESPNGPYFGFEEGKRSFRIDGTQEELDLICKSLGFSGISDLSVNPDEYQEVMSRHSPLHNVFEKFESIAHPRAEDDSNFTTIGYHREVDASEVFDVIDRPVEVTDEALDSTIEFLCEDTIRGSTDSPRHSGSSNGLGVNRFRGPSNGIADGLMMRGVTSCRTKALRGNGINGLRPQELATPPLSTFLVKDDDKDLPAWDLSRYVLDRYKNDAGTCVVNEENRMLSGSCSFTASSTDDDTSSTTTELMLNVSPTGKSGVIEEWQKGDLIGHGSVGAVYEGFADCGLIFAVKEVSLVDQGVEGKQRILQLQQEIALLSQFQHENIVRYYGTKKDESHLYIFLELVPKGSLLSLYRKYELRVSQVSIYTRQILRGLKYLHDRNVIHRDVKCANILVETNRFVKLADFGLAKAIKLSDVKSCKGTAFWMAPEVVRSMGYGLAADIWSLGCTVLEMLTRNFPYSGLEPMAALFRIGSGERPDIPNSVSGDARDFVLKCLQVDPSLRPTAAQLLCHSFVSSSSSSSNIDFPGRMRNTVST